MKLTTDSVDSELMLMLRKHANFVLSSVQRETQKFDEAERETMTRATELFNCFAPSALRSSLQDLINKRLPNDGSTERCQMREVELLIRFLFALGYYNKLP